MQCELCGRESKGCRDATLDGAKMILCPECIKHSENVIPVPKTPESVKRFVTQKARKARPKDIYKDMDKELVSNWSEIIIQARKKRGLTRENLGFKIGERTVTISKIENGDLRPSDKMIAKLEKELGISLLEDVKKVTTNHHTNAGMTLGDFIKKEK
jgi:putative transcription factor